MNILGIIKANLFGKPKYLQTPEDVAAAEAAKSTAATVKQAPASIRKAGPQSMLTRREAATAKRAARTDGSGRPSAGQPADTANARRTVSIVLPSGKPAGHGWEPLAPAGLLTMYDALHTSRTKALLDHSRGLSVGDETGRLLSYISPIFAREDKLHYELDGRLFATLAVKRWPGRFDPARWLNFYRIQPALPFSLSIHHSRMPSQVAVDDLRNQAERIKLEMDESELKYGRMSAEFAQLSSEYEKIMALRERLVYEQSRFFHTSAYVRVSGRDEAELAEAIAAAKEAARRADNLSLVEVPGEQRDAYLSSMPVSEDEAYFTTGRDAERCREIFPYVTRTVAEKGRAGRVEGVLYGIHAYNDTPVVMSPFNRDGGVEITTVLGKIGSGKTFWLRTHMGRMAMVGTRLIAIDPLGDFRRFFENNGGQIISVKPGSDTHINPFRREFGFQVKDIDTGEVAEGYEDADSKVDRLLPMFALMLGAEYTGTTEALLGAAIHDFYDRYGTEEHLMADFIAVLADIRESATSPLSERMIRERDTLVNILTLKCLRGQYRSFFSSKTNLTLRDDDPSSRLICFDLLGLEGESLAFSAFMAVTMARSIANRSMERKEFLVDEIHRLLSAGASAGSRGIPKMLDDLARTCRHWNTALVFATQFFSKDPELNNAQAPILQSATTYVLLRGTEPMLREAAKLVGEAADERLLMRLLLADSEEADQRVAARTAIVYRNGRPTPIMSVGLPFEIAEDNPESGISR